MSSPPIPDNKDQEAPSVFEPTALLRESRRQKGLPAVEMEAAALYSFARTRQKPVLCLAHLFAIQ